MKKNLKIIFSVLMMVVTIVGTMTVVSLADTPVLSATPIVCSDWDGETPVDVTFTLSGSDFDYDEYAVHQGGGYYQFENGTAVHDCEPGDVYKLYGRNTGHHTWHEVEGVSVEIILEHAKDETAMHYTPATCTLSGVDLYYDCFCKDVQYDKNGNVIEDITAWSQEDGDGYIAPNGHMPFWGVEEYAAPGHRSHTCHVLRCDTCKEVLDYHRVYYTDRELVEEEPATCGTPGHKAYYTCDGDNCDLYFTNASGEGEENIIGDSVMLKRWLASGGEGYIAPTGNHTWDNGTVQKDGSTEYRCTVCGAIKVEPAKGVVTGDSENIIFWIIMSVAMASALGFTLYKRNN